MASLMRADSSVVQFFIFAVRPNQNQRSHHRTGWFHWLVGDGMALATDYSGAQAIEVRAADRDWIWNDWTMIKDTAATDVSINPQPARRKQRLTWLALVAAMLLAGGLLLPGMASWLSSEVTVSAERLRIARVERGDFIRDLGVEGQVIAAVSPTLYASAAGGLALVCGRPEEDHRVSIGGGNSGHIDQF